MISSLSLLNDLGTDFVPKIFDGLAKSPPVRHPVEKRSPEVLDIPGFRLPPE
jgi:hypothetical protein